MHLSTLHLHDFRNFEQAQLTLAAGCNLLYGENGSGKTSLLEAIYQLILGRSFRSHLVRRVIRRGAQEFALFGKIERVGGPITVGVTRSVNAAKRIRINDRTVASNLEVTQLLPVQLLNHDSYRLLCDGPEARRQFIDWGLFHVEQEFLAAWRKVERILRQRNEALRGGATENYLRIWDGELASAGEKLHYFRERYLQELLPLGEQILQQLLPDVKLTITYYPGWDLTNRLMEALIAARTHDRQLGYSTIGPHRADLRIRLDGAPARDRLSRGQQKLVAYGLQIAQGLFLFQARQQRCLCLLDDFSAELDVIRTDRLAQLLMASGNFQLIITGLQPDWLAAAFSAVQSQKTFKVYQGTMIEQ